MTRPGWYSRALSYLVSGVGIEVSGPHPRAVRGNVNAKPHCDHVVAACLGARHWQRAETARLLEISQRKAHDVDEGAACASPGVTRPVRRWSPRPETRARPTPPLRTCN